MVWRTPSTIDEVREWTSPTADELRRVEALEAHIATLEAAVAKAEALGKQQHQEVETAAKRVGVLEAHIATLEAAVAKAEALGKQQHQEVETAAKRVAAIEAEID